MKDSPFDSPLESYEKVHRRATVLPGFKPNFINQSTQTSYNNNNSRQNLFEQDESIYRQSTNGLLPVHSANRSTNNKSSVERSSNSANLSNKSTSRSSDSLENRTKTNQSIKRSMIHSAVKNSIKENSMQNKTGKLKDVSNMTNQNSKYNEIATTRKDERKSKYDKSNYISFSHAHVYEPDDEIIKDHVQTELIESLLDSSTFKDLNLESLISKKSTADSTKFSKSGKTKNYSRSFSDPTRSTNKSLKRSDLISVDFADFDLDNEKTTNRTSDKSANKSAKKSFDNSVKDASKHGSMIKNLSTKNSFRPAERRKSILKKPVQQVEEDKRTLICNIDGDKIEDLSDVSLILNSTCSQEEPNDDKTKSESESKLKESDHNLELDLSIIGLDASVSSDVEVVFEDEQSTCENQNIEPNSKSFSNFNEEIELCRKSISQHSSPQLSVVSTSISETLSQPESSKKSTNVEKSKEQEDFSIEFHSDDEKSPAKSTGSSMNGTPKSTGIQSNKWKSTSISKTLPQSSKKNMNNEKSKEQEDFSIEFNSDDERSPAKSVCSSVNGTPRSADNQSIKSTPKSILKKNSSKRIWDASEFSLVDLTIGSSANKSSSNHRKSNSVRFSDNVSEKFTRNLSFKRDDKTGQSNGKSLDQSIDRSISETISKCISEAIVSSKSNEHSLESEEVEANNASLPDLDDDESYANLDEERNTHDEESEEESLNVTIDELNESLNDVEEEEQNDDADRTPVNTPEVNKHQSTFTVKSLKKRPRKAFKNVNKKQLPKYYETFVDQTPTIIYPHHDDEQPDSVRRSSRIRVRPLDFWRCQKPNYRLDKDTKCLTIDGVEKGFRVDNPFKRKRLNTNQPKRSIKKDKKSKKRKHHSLEDDDQEDEREVVRKRRYNLNDEISIHQQLNRSAIELSDKIKKEATEFCTHGELKWSESKQSKGVHIAFMNRSKGSNGKMQATGFMKLDPLLKKPPQKTGNYMTNYVVMFGAASIKIGDKKDEKLDDKPAVILKSMDGFSLPENTLFSIDNLRTDELLLYFSLTKL